MIVLAFFSPLPFFFFPPQFSFFPLRFFFSTLFPFFLKLPSIIFWFRHFRTPSKSFKRFSLPQSFCLSFFHIQAMIFAKLFIGRLPPLAASFWFVHQWLKTWQLHPLIPFTPIPIPSAPIFFCFIQSKLDGSDWIYSVLFLLPIISARLQALALCFYESFTF